MKGPEAVANQACPILHMLSYRGNKCDIKQYYNLIGHSGFKWVNVWRTLSKTGYPLSCLRYYRNLEVHYTLEMQATYIMIQE